MSDFNSVIERQNAETPESERDELEPELSVIRAMIDARRWRGMTQRELSELTGIAQSDISKFENGNANPSLRTLNRLAE